jgi:hypothetical protein
MSLRLRKWKWLEIECTYHEDLQHMERIQISLFRDRCLI